MGSRDRPAKRKRRNKSPSFSSSRRSRPSRSRSLSTSSSSSSLSSKSSKTRSRSKSKSKCSKSRTHTRSKSPSKRVPRYKKPFSSDAPRKSQKVWSRHEKRPFSYDRVKNVMEIPEEHRVNYGFADSVQLDSCPVGKKFWYDEEHKGCTKYFLRIYDTVSNWKDGHFVVIEQEGLEVPRKYKMTFEELFSSIKVPKTPELDENQDYDPEQELEPEPSPDPTLQETPKPRIWLNIRDFDLDLVAAQLKHLAPFITHFSFGYRLSYEEHKIDCEDLLFFIFNEMPNLEYLTVADDLLTNMYQPLPPYHDKIPPLLHLKTVRLIQRCFEMSPFLVLEILKRAPRLERIYEVPLHHYQEINGLLQKQKQGIMSLDGVMRSFSICRRHYSNNMGRNALDFVDDLKAVVERNSKASKTKVSRNWNWNQDEYGLEELNTRTFFIQNSKLRHECLDLMGQILEQNVTTMKKLVVEAAPSVTCYLKVPKLENLETLVFEMKRNLSTSRSFFKDGFNVAKSFPKLKNVEILLDKRNDSKYTNRSYQGCIKKALFEKHFPRFAFVADESFKNVTNLTLIRFSPVDVVGRLGALFPNVRSFKLKCGLPDARKVLMRFTKQWPRLEQLILDVDMDVLDGNLDYTLTGINPSKCAKLAKCDLNKGEKYSDEAVQEWAGDAEPIAPISLLQNLKLLQFIFRPFQNLEFKSETPPLTKVSYFYGFGNGRIPNLLVQIGFQEATFSVDKKKMIERLQSIIPYVYFLDD